ncbi:hypothetical protein F2Q69_00047538 [Brassica cretica]|uniref:Uncharacterized protein n=1 Tax=Brassica cretica TaxID=69181 RepID=A0A8S9Q1G6_BRACR|nr:hypothetical protein F2Q69_00047538 [Brassica cretica]
MAPSFSYPLPTIKTDRLGELYTVHGVHRAVVVDLAYTSESPEATTTTSTPQRASSILNATRRPA